MANAGQLNHSVLMAGEGFAGRFKTETMSSQDPFEQESDMMERLPTKAVAIDAEAEKIPLVSLGCSCAPKMSFKEMGRGSETLPFDWVRTTLDGLVHFLASDFKGYFEYTMDQEIQLPNQTKTMHMFRSPLHSFWHDDPRMPAMLERYKRRIVRFNGLDAHSQPVLFVRSVASSEEVRYASYLVKLLVERFGPQASLLMIVDFQGAQAPGVFAVASEPNLMLNFFPTETGAAPHAGAIRTALDWVLGRSYTAAHVATPEEAMKFMKPTDWGLLGTSGVFAFEGVQVGADSVAKVRAMKAPPALLIKPAREGDQLSDLLEKKPSKIEMQLDAERSRIPLVSLGSSLTPKLSFKAMGRGTEIYPFDWIRVSLQGIMHFLRLDFADFFEFTTQQDVFVPDQNYTFRMYRSQHHSFWYDDPTHLGMRETYQRRIKNFNALDAKTEPVLFVRALATTDELKHAGKLMRAMIDRFGTLATLLLIVDFQGTEAPGACVIQSEPNLLVYFLNTQRSESAYCTPIATALDWVVGKSIQARTLLNIEAAVSAVCEDHSQMHVSGVAVFEKGANEEFPEWTFNHYHEDDWKNESEIMETIPARITAPDKIRDTIPLVSLGCSCGPKLSFKDIGRGAETLPFDWVRTRVAGVMNLISSNFEGFYEFSHREEIFEKGQDKPMVMFRSKDHSFWHDDPTHDAMRERYDRRIERFERVGSTAQHQGVLFVRSAADSNELAQAGALSRLLVQKYGQFATLLFIVDFQGEDALGACIVKSEPNLMVHFLDTTKQDSAAPYGTAITTALDWLVGRSVAAGQLESIAEAMTWVKPTNWGLYGQGGVVAFDSAL